MPENQEHETAEAHRDYDVVVIGGGQAGLAAGYYLRRSGLRYVILDGQKHPGGSWQHGWQSLSLFSPARWSSLPGWIMPGSASEYPGKDALLEYMSEYEKRYALPIQRPVRITSVRRSYDAASASYKLVLSSDHGEWRAHAVASATGSWERPYIPFYPGAETFGGMQVHSGFYHDPAAFSGKRTLVVGGGNSGAQIYAEVSRVADATWVTLQDPIFMPDYVDGKYLFDVASRRYLAQQQPSREPEEAAPAVSLGDIVMVPVVREARERGVLHSVRPFTRFTQMGVVWEDGWDEPVDAIIWCTGFRPALAHLEPLGVVEHNGQVLTDGTHSVKEPLLWLIGYGEWTGFASATIVGVGRTARSTVEEITSALRPG